MLSDRKPKATNEQDKHTKAHRERQQFSGHQREGAQGWVDKD